MSVSVPYRSESELDYLEGVYVLSVKIGTTKRHLIKKQKHMIETGIIDNRYAEQSLKTWRSYALKRKQSFQSVHSICDFYANVIGGK